MRFLVWIAPDHILMIVLNARTWHQLCPTAIHSITALKEFLQSSIRNWFVTRDKW